MPIFRDSWIINLSSISFSMNCDKFNVPAEERSSLRCTTSKEYFRSSFVMCSPFTIANIFSFCESEAQPQKIISKEQRAKSIELIAKSRGQRAITNNPPSHPLEKGGKGGFTFCTLLSVLSS